MTEKPIFIQLKEMIENHIITGEYKTGDLVISSTQICRLYNVNPATAMRALAELADSGVIIKDRGIGMRVTDKAYEIIMSRRVTRFSADILGEMFSEAKKLGISKEKLISMIKENYDSN